uniref:Uncharacterized protein n=1 Tax=uncultured marine virus TaxID=186617 RepID=A0A0F7LBE3_9VIRU|nr:hypothetical protein [uncultured marine virus]
MPIWAIPMCIESRKVVYIWYCSNFSVSCLFWQTLRYKYRWLNGYWLVSEC